MLGLFANIGCNFDCSLQVGEHILAGITYDTSRVTVLEHPLVQHKIAILRDKDTKVPQFRQLVRELAQMEVYEATREVPTQEIKVTTPLMGTTGQKLADDAFCIVPILRAGMGMLEGALDMLPSANVGVLGMERDEITHEPHEYYAKMPSGIENKTVLLIDPMLATGGSALAAISYLRKAGVKDLRALFLVGAPQGAKAVLEADPDVHIWLAAMDDDLNDAAYILPGLGDAGDRIFGTLG